MRLGLPSRALCILLAASGQAEVIDRIAVSVGSSVITASDIDRDIRVTAFLNGVPPDFSAASRRATADRMVEQKLVRRELEISRYPVPEASAAEPEFEAFRKEHYPADAEFQSALAHYGISEQEVRDEMLWQLTLLRFIEVRFRPAVEVSEQDVQEYFDRVVKPAAQAAHPGQPVTLDDYRGQIQSTLTGKRADAELDNWLKETRQRTEIVYHQEAFQ